jgi:hypothetical protein
VSLSAVRVRFGCLNSFKRLIIRLVTGRQEIVIYHNVGIENFATNIPLKSIFVVVDVIINSGTNISCAIGCSLPLLGC